MRGQLSKAGGIGTASASQLRGSHWCGLEVQLLKTFNAPQRVDAHTAVRGLLSGQNRPIDSLTLASFSGRPSLTNPAFTREARCKSLSESSATNALRENDLFCPRALRGPRFFPRFPLQHTRATRRNELNSPFPDNAQNAVNHREEAHQA